MSSRSRSRSKYVDDYDDDFNEEEVDDDEEDNEYEEDFETSTRHTTTHKSTTQSKQQQYHHHQQQHHTDQSSFRTNDNSNLYNNSFDERTNTSSKSGLSSKELKTKLIESLKNKGILDSMKSQLRNKLVLGLNPNLEQNKNKPFLENNNIIANTNNQKSNLALNTINCLIIDHLKTNEYDYTLSVFMPECSIGLNEVYNLSDILHILKVSPESKLYTELSNSALIKSKGLLWYLVSYFCAHYVTHEMGTQTEFDPSLNKASLDFKLKKLDSLYSSKSDDLSLKLKLDDKMILYQNNLEEKLRKEYQDKMNHFMEIELLRMRQEEKEKLRAEMQPFRKNLEQTYQKRLEALEQREQSMTDMLKQRKELEERELFVQRQHLLDEMKQLKEREADFKRNADMQAKFYSSDVVKYEKLDEELKRRELKLKEEQEALEQRLRDERERIKLDLERAYAQREFVLQSIETKNKQDSTHNEIERAHLERLKREYQNQQIKLNEMEIELQKCLGQVECFKQENELLKQKLTHCMDYDFIKQENTMLKFKLDVSKEIIGKKSISSSRRSTNEKIYVPQRKRSVTFADNVPPGGVVPPLALFSKNEDLSLMQATELGADQLQKDTARSNIADLAEDDEKALETFRDAGDRILSDEIEKSEIKDTLEHHNLVNNELRDLYEMQVYEQRKLQETITDVKKHIEFLYHGVPAMNETKVNSSLNEVVLDTSIDFIETAKERLKHLEEEGERIEQNYREHQHNLKSKYYPITENDSTHKGVKEKMNEQKRMIDIEKFLESTMKANVNAKVLREELEAEFNNVKTKSQEREKHYNVSEIKNVEELIKTVPISKEQFDMESIKKKILEEQNDFKRFQDKRETNFVLKNDYLDNTSQHSVSYSQIQIPRTRSPVKQSMSYDDEESKSTNIIKETPNDNNKQSARETSELSSPKAKPANFGLGDYVKMFDNNKQKSEEKSEKVEPVRRSVKIEYSSSSSSTNSTTSDDDTSQGRQSPVKQTVLKKETASKDDDEDDFW